MSVGPLGGLAATVAGTSLAQAKGSDVERAQHAAGSHERRINNEFRAEQAAGIGEADGENHEANERDADGRRLWEEQARTADSSAAASEGEPKSKDATGQCGRLLDLSG